MAKRVIHYDDPEKFEKSAQPTIRLPKKGFQPSRSDMEEEIDMPGLSEDEARAAFSRKFQFKREDG